MATITAKDDPQYPDVYLLAEDDAATGGEDGVMNKQAIALVERTDHLKARAVALETAAEDHEDRIATVETSGAVSVNRVTALLSAEVMAVEMFAGEPYVWRDIEARAVVQTVAGDDSVDVADTSDLTEGDSYVITDDDGSTEVITVETKLTEARFQASAALTKSRDATGTLSRTSWTIESGYALAQDGGVFFSKRIRVLRYDDSGRLMLRRDAGDGSIAVGVRTAGSGDDWTACPLVSSDAVDDEDDLVELEYTVPIGGVVQFRLEASAGESGDAIQVDHIRVLPPTDAVRDLIRQPSITAPTDGETDISETPTLEGATYYSLYGVAQADAEFRVATDEQMTTVIYTGTLGAAGTQCAVPADTLETDGTYWCDVRYQDADGNWSLRSEAVGFSCASVFAYIAAPTIVAPAEEATSVSLTPTITLSAFSSVGETDTHSATQIQIATDSAFASVVYDTTLGAVTAHTLDADDSLDRQTTYYLRARYTGEALGTGGWSTTRTFETVNVGNAPTITSPEDGDTIGTTPTITLSTFSFPGTSESHTASQYRITDEAGTVLYDSGTTTDLTSHTVPDDDALTNSTDVLILARQKGGTTGWTPWSETVACTTVAPSGSILYTTAGIYTFTVSDNVTELRGLAIGGGEGVGNTKGGGSGNLVTGTLSVSPGDTIAIVVGAGGDSGGYDTVYNAGGTSMIGSTLIAYGGGYAGNGDGGSGGGARRGGGAVGNSPGDGGSGGADGEDTTYDDGGSGQGTWDLSGFRLAFEAGAGGSAINASTGANASLEGGSGGGGGIVIPDVDSPEPDTGGGYAVGDPGEGFGAGGGSVSGYNSTAAGYSGCPGFVYLEWGE